MNSSRIKIILLLSWGICFMLPTAFCQPNGVLSGYERIYAVQEQPSGHPDLDLYYKQVSNNKYDFINRRRRHLFDTTPMEHFFIGFMERGFTVAADTASLFELFDASYYTVEEQLATIGKMYETARKHNNQRLKRMADYFHGRSMAYDYRKFDEMAPLFEKLIQEARRAGDYSIEAYALKEMHYHSYYSQRAVLSFSYARRLAENLEGRGVDYPLKGTDYIRMGATYYNYKDYGRATAYLHKGLSYRGGERSRGYVRACLSAWNYLATLHHVRGDLDSAAFYHRTIIESPESMTDDPIHSAIAICNLGQIEMEKGRYDAAIALMQAGLAEIESNPRDRDFKYGIFTALAECMLAKGEMQAVKAYIDKTRNGIYNFPESAQMNRLKALFALESKYYSRLGEHDRATSCLDSALYCTRRYEQLTGEHIILRGEQELEEAEMRLDREEITRQKRQILLALIILTIVLSALIIVVQLYRKKSAAYKALAQRAKEWAKDTAPRIADTAERESNGTNKSNDRQQPTEKEIELIERVHEMMINRQIYRDSTLTLDSLAQLFGVNRETVSRSINHVTGKNISRFLNEYRIKEAVRFLSTARNRVVNFDDLSEQVGFKNRETFHRTFKQITGLPPNTFKNNG